MQITVEVRAGRNLGSFLEKDKPDGVNIHILPSLLHRDFGQDTTTFIIAFATGIAGNLIATWLFEKFKEQPPKKVTIRKQEITWDKGELTRVIEEEVKIEEQGGSGAE